MFLHSHCFKKFGSFYREKLAYEALSFFSGPGVAPTVLIQGYGTAV